MELDKAILRVLEDVENGVGRTTLQKLMYFASMKGIIHASFKPYYYGPYADDVYGEIQNLVSLRFVEERPETYSSGHTGYLYRITPDGKEILPRENQETAGLNHIVRLADDHFGLDQKLLSSAAKVHFVLHSHNVPMTPENIRDEAGQLGWEVSPKNAADVFGFLKDLDLVLVK